MRLEVRGKYLPDWPDIAFRTREAAGFRCVRCGHRHVPKDDARRLGIQPSPGEWSPCDEYCSHKGQVRVFTELEGEPGSGHWWETEALVPVGTLIRRPIQWMLGLIEARWRVLTVHHLNGDKANNRWWNLLALCQVCHLYIQGVVIPERPWLFEHSDWFKPYVAGFYAWYYGGHEITQEEALADLPRWLALNPVGLYIMSQGPVP